jgi:hypothetical protein
MDEPVVLLPRALGKRLGRTVVDYLCLFAHSPGGHFLSSRYMDLFLVRHIPGKVVVPAEKRGIRIVLKSARIHKRILQA